MTTVRATVVPLREHPEHCAFFAAAFEAEWPSWYGPGGQGNAQADLLAFANQHGALPVGVVALGPGNQPLGVAALKAISIPSHSHLSPWAAAGYVAPAWRRQGIGALLLEALLHEASRLGYQAVYCATSASESLLVRQGWNLMQSVQHEGHSLQVFHRAVPSNAA
jgi:GNAT superfamily N-acetyltransferase